VKIGLILENLDPRRGGVEQWTCEFARALLSLDHEVHVVAGHFGPARPEGIVRHVVETGRSRCDMAAAAERALRRLDLDVIHDMGVGWHSDVFQPHGGSRRAAFERNLALTPRWQRGLKRHLAGLLPRYRDFDRLIARQYADDGRLFLALSKMVADHFRSLHDVPDDQIRLVYNGVDTERFSPCRCRAFRKPTRAALGLTDEVLLLIVAHNYRLKGVPTLCRAAGRLARDGANVRVAVVGGKRQATTTRQKGGLVQYLGPVEDATPYYAAADVYVHPTFYDPCSLVVLEALACGLPVVTSRYNGAGELITSGREGHVIDDPADARELAESLVPLLDAPWRATMGAAARRLAEQHTIQYNCHQVLDVYREIDSSARRAA